MIYTEHFQGIKLDIQTADLTIDEKIQEHIREMIGRLRRHISQINWVDIYFKKENSQAIDNRTISVRLGIPGNDAFASNSGTQWIAVLKKVEEKLRRQLRKRKKDNSDFRLFL